MKLIKIARKIVADERKQQAFKLGQRAFQKGMKSSPVLDKEMMGMLKDNPNMSNAGISKETVALLKEWSRGWHTENLK